MALQITECEACGGSYEYAHTPDSMECVMVQRDRFRAMSRNARCAFCDDGVYRLTTTAGRKECSNCGSTALIGHKS